MRHYNADVIIPRATNDFVKIIRHGFTLIELLVVIAIIVLLAGLLLPVLARAKARALVVACLNHERQMGIAMNMYVGDSHAYPFWIAFIGSADSDNILHWEDALHIYYPLSWTNRDYHCPAYRGVIATRSSGSLPGYPGSYAYNYWGTQNGASGSVSLTSLGLGGLNYGGPANAQPVKLAPVSDSQVTVPSEMFAISDARVRNTGGDLPGQWGGEDYMACEPTSPFSSGNLLYSQTQAPPQHGQNFNLLFCDGHVKPVDRLQLFNPTNTGIYWNNDHQPHPETW